MDGSSYEIAIGTQAPGLVTTADQLNALAASLDAASAVTTSFDSAIQQAQALLAEASSAAEAAAAAVGASSAKYNSLEIAAERAAKAVDRAAQAGQDTSALQAKAADAAAALQAQGAALDELKAKAASANAAEAQLTHTLDSLQAAAKKEAGALAGAGQSGAGGIEAVMFAGQGALGPLGGLFGRLNMVKNALRTGLAGGAAFAGLAVIALTIALVGAVFELAKFALLSNKIQSQRLDGVIKKAKDNFAKLFSGVHVDKFVKGLEDITKGLDENTATGKGLRAVFETILNPLFDAIPKLVPYVQQLFRGFVLGALLAEIAALKLYIAVRNMLPDSVKKALKDLTSNIDWMATAMNAGVVAVGIFTVALGILTAILLVLAIAIASPFILGAVVIFAIGTAVAYVIGWFSQLKNWVAMVGAALSEFKTAASDAASGLINGLVNGVKNGTGLVVEALRSLGKSAIGALKSALGIASPSRYAIEFAGNLTDTFTDHVERGQGDAQSAMAGLAEPRSKGGAGGNDGTTAGGQGKRANVTFIFEGVKDAEHAESRFRELLTATVEGDVIALGGKLAPT